jgi:multiple sugar transport system permease protein
VVVPISLPGIVAVGIWSFLFAWCEYLYASTFVGSVSKRMITTGIVELLGHFIIQWGLVMAYAIIVSAPILILFVFLQQYFVSGLTAGGVK